MSFFRKLFIRERAAPQPPLEEAPGEALDSGVPQSAAAPAFEPPAAASSATEPATIPPPVHRQDHAADPSGGAASRRRWFERLKQGMAKSSRSLTSGITDIFTKRRLDAATLDELEDVLIRADLGPATAQRIVAAVGEGRYDREIDPDDVRRVLATELAKVLAPAEIALRFDETRRPFVILVVGVNGSGKTTTIGKLGAIAKREGYSVAFAACDTFRAAAIEQLSIWAERIGARLFARPSGADAAGLAFDALQAAREERIDVLIIDTAGRLQNKASLMAELEKIVRVLKKLDPAAPHANLLVLDATTGQNALAQVEAFHRTAAVTGLVMTKLDGTARGGILVAITEKFGLPVHAIGVGEGIDDLQPFAADAFSRAIAGLALEVA
jgi:fused signal recognition particle receptor